MAESHKTLCASEPRRRSGEKRNQAFKDFVEYVQVESSPHGCEHWELLLISLENKADALITTFVVDFQVTDENFSFSVIEIEHSVKYQMILSPDKLVLCFSDSRKGLGVVISITSRYVIMINIFSQFSLYPSMPRKSGFIIPAFQKKWNYYEAVHCCFNCLHG